MEEASGQRAPPRRPRVRAPRDLVAGLAIAGIAAVALLATGDLDPGRLRAMGPGMLPRTIAAVLGLAGLALVASAFLKDGEPLGRWSLRGPAFISLAVVAFALTIRTVGLGVAGPLVMLLGGAASPEVRWKELAIFTAVTTLACAGLFRFALGLPIPVLILPGFRL